MPATTSRPRRDAERTRARILVAARAEFSRNGFEGTRISSIARRAEVNPSLIFYYFGSKSALYHAVTERRLAAYVPSTGDAPATRDEVLDWPVWLFRLDEDTHAAVRAVLREAIGAEQSRPRLLDEERRRESFQQQVARVRGAQERGELPSAIDAERLTLLLYVLGVYPYMLPQSAQLITGHAPDDPAFRASFERFAHDLAHLLAARDQSPVSTPARRSATTRTRSSNST